MQPLSGFIVRRTIEAFQAGDVRGGLHHINGADPVRLRRQKI
jgi:hypothetical protein